MYPTEDISMLFRLTPCEAGGR